MGICMSNFRRSSSHSLKNKVRSVVHINGFVEDFDHPITVQKVIGTGKNMHPKQFLCIPNQRLFEGSKLLKLEAQLKPGCIYFLLPDSTLWADVSPVDFAALVRKLIAKSNCNVKGASKKSSLSWNFMCSPVWSSPGRSPIKSPGYSIGGLQYD